MTVPPSLPCCVISKSMQVSGTMNLDIKECSASRFDIEPFSAVRVKNIAASEHRCCTVFTSLQNSRDFLYGHESVQISGVYERCVSTGRLQHEESETSGGFHQRVCDREQEWEEDEDREKEGERRYSGQQQHLCSSAALCVSVPPVEH